MTDGNVDSGKGDHLEFDGMVDKTAKGILTVILETGSTVTAYLSGRMRQNKINVVPGDRVRVKISPYDLSRGFITYRY